MDKEKVSQVKDFLNLECSLFSVTKKCFKKCLKVPFIFMLEGKTILPQEIFTFQKNSIKKQEFEQFFLKCIESCSEDFIIGRRFYKEKLMEDSDRVQTENTELYEGIYSDKK